MYLVYHLGAYVQQFSKRDDAVAFIMSQGVHQENFEILDGSDA
jgi:hypothetical protein